MRETIENSVYHDQNQYQGSTDRLTKMLEREPRLSFDECLDQTF